MSKTNKKRLLNDPGYPPSPPDEDIYNKEKEAENKDPVNPSQEKSEENFNDNRQEGDLEDDDITKDTDNGGQMVGVDPENPNRKGVEQRNPGESDREDLDLNEENDRMGDDLDVPGSDLDDANEDIGEEDEENNYYSLGGDNDPEDNRDYS